MWVWMPLQGSEEWGPEIQFTFTEIDSKFIREILTSKIRTRKNKETLVHSVWLIRNVPRDRNWGCPGDPCLVSSTEYSGALSVQR